ncbi:hypothetical protein CLAVI_000415 [Candidatus Clavichlamydia salmonicola]|uniref:hypothetical protein n=1 Tax=Candidatus Clavichlamydia salmonicola TaxID=469812 RepID=UPI00189116AB|nr:hypothetical protein [Candidatus Clavichlamydia salmonicola]MBF5050796.1 hypothetical protein [Candidatus Clavichlamydia salmonicola]
MSGVGNIGGFNKPSSQGAEGSDRLDGRPQGSKIGGGGLFANRFFVSLRSNSERVAATAKKACNLMAFNSVAVLGVSVGVISRGLVKVAEWFRNLLGRVRNMRSGSNEANVLSSRVTTAANLRTSTTPILPPRPLYGKATEVNASVFMDELKQKIEKRRSEADEVRPSPVSVKPKVDSGSKSGSSVNARPGLTLGPQAPVFMKELKEKLAERDKKKK